jgi:creatinine amidohydrolase
MQWELLTAPRLLQARQECGGVAVLPIGSLEKHSGHLPTGIDSIAVHRLCIAATEREPAVVLPPLFYTNVIEMKNNIGAIALDTCLLFQMVENILDEVARNGFRKILLVSGHGGNRFWLPLLMQHLGDKGKEYAAYLARPESAEKLKALQESSLPDWHAGELETSMALYLVPDACDMGALPPAPGVSKRGTDVPAYTPVEWYSFFPDAYAGDARTASAEKGKSVYEVSVEALAQCIRAVKKDTQVLEHMKRFSRESRSL